MLEMIVDLPGNRLQIDQLINMKDKREALTMTARIRCVYCNR